ncbi:MAG: class I SAM-dependent methyltransferase, partial [Alphaproteobacteria bacterium]|nr:class I SAM-dependent methyltransferase [Alphaproteobacteria bacterium]
MTTPLLFMLHERIRAEGPLRLDDFMQLALQHPEHGYYVHKNAVGAEGDFTTAPEISQIFGEMVALWLVAEWEAMGKPAPLSLVELGPGQGTLMADIMRTLRRVAPSLAKAAHVFLIESNQTLRARQAEKLKDVQPQWIADLAHLPAQPFMLVANEFLDALPVRQFIRQGGGWCEVHVGLKGQELGLLQTPPDAALDQLLGLTAVVDDTVREISPMRDAWLRTIADALNAQGGAALFIDYGDDAFQGHSTLHAYARHQPVAFTHAPGETDLSADVDFGAAIQTLTHQGLQVSPLQTQAQWLRQQGAEWRAGQMCAAALPLAFQVTQGLARLLAPNQLGERFKVLSARSPARSAALPTT